MICVFAAAVTWGVVGASPLRGLPVRGDESLPSLPTVDKVMQPSKEVARAITTDSRKLSAAIAARAANVRASLVSQKASFEKLIAKDFEENRVIYDQNLNRKAGINDTIKRMEILRLDNKAIANSSNIMRATIKEFRSKVHLAVAFLNLTDEEVGGLTQTEVEALRPPPPERNYEFYLDKARKDVGVSFLQVAETEAKTAKDMIQKLSWTVGRVSQAEKHSMDMLRERFDEVNQTQAQRHVRLLNWTARLDQEWSSLNATKEDLWVAQKHLKKTNNDIRQSLIGIRAFQQSVARRMAEALLQSERASHDVTP